MRSLTWCFKGKLKIHGQHYSKINMKRTVALYTVLNQLWSRRWFSRDQVSPLHSGCADPCEFPKWRKLYKIYDSGGLRLYLHLNENLFLKNCINDKSTKGWRDGSVVKSPGYSCTGPRFISSDPRDGPPVTPLALQAPWMRMIQFPCTDKKDPYT